MKKAKILILIFSFSAINLLAVGPLDFGFKVGLSVPNGEFDRVYNNLKDTSQADLSSKVLGQASSGYHLGVNLRTTVVPLVDIYGSFGIHRFTENTLKIVNPLDTSKKYPELNTVQNIVPITGGLNFIALNLKVLKLYLSGEVNYNYISYSTDLKVDGSPSSIPISYQESEVQSRMGYGIGVGAEANVFLVKLFVDAKINQPNLIGRIDGEELKKFYTLSLGIYF